MNRPYKVKTHGGIDSLLLFFESYHVKTGISMGCYDTLSGAIRACKRHEEADNRRKIRGQDSSHPRSR